MLQYSYQHNNPNETEYYRLKQVDFDGQLEYSKTIAVKSHYVIDVILYPNPSKGNMFFDVNELKKGVYNIVYTNVLGSVSKELLEIVDGKNTYQLNQFENLLPGIYFIQVLNDSNEIISNQKVVKE